MLYNNQKLEIAITEGLQSGEPKEFDVDAFKQRMLKSIENNDL